MVRSYLHLILLVRADTTQVHADASNFAEGVTKEDAYEQVLLQAEGLLDGQRNWVSSCPLSVIHIHVAC